MLRRTKKLDCIVSSFDKTVRDLEALTQRNNESIDFHRELAEQSKAEEMLLRDENNRAERISSNIRKLMDVV